MSKGTTSPNTVCLNLVLFLVSISAPSVAQVTTGSAASSAITSPSRLTSGDVDVLMNRAYAVEGEFGADGLLRILESGAVTDRKDRLRVLQAALALTNGTQEPIQRALVFGASVDSRNGAKYAGMFLRLDRLSLQLRAIRALLDLDPRAARSTFVGLDLQVPSVPCSTNLIYEVEDYYRTVRPVFEQSFSNAERAAGDDVVFLRSRLRLQSPSQVRPIAVLLESLGTSTDILQSLLADFAQDLATLDGDDRSFSNDTRSDLESLTRLVRTATSRQAHAEVLLQAIRKYLVGHARKGRCEDNLRNRRTLNPHTLASFNDAILLLGDSKSISPIAPNEITPASILERAQDHPYWISPEASRLMEAFKMLRFTGKLERSDRESPQWRSEFLQFLHDLDKWRPTSESDRADYLHQKAILLESLVRITPNGDERAKLLSDFVSFLNNWDLKRDDRLQWLWRGRELLNPQYRRSSSDPSGNIARLLLTNTVFAFYIEIERVTGRPFWK